MTEKRAGDVELGEHVRLIGDLIEDFGEVINTRTVGDDVFMTLSYPDRVTIFPVDLPVMDADEVLEVKA